MRSLIKASLKFLWHNVKSQEVKWVELFILDISRRWKKQMFRPFPGASANGTLFLMLSLLSTYAMCVCNNFKLWPVFDLHSLFCKIAKILLQINTIVSDHLFSKKKKILCFYFIGAKNPTKKKLLQEHCSQVTIIWRWNSQVSTLSSLRAGRSILDSRTRILYLRHCVHIGFGPHSTSYLMGTGGSFPG